MNKKVCPNCKGAGRLPFSMDAGTGDIPLIQLLDQRTTPRSEMTPCPICKGSGEVCSGCGGTGRILSVGHATYWHNPNGERSDIGTYASKEIPCPMCIKVG